MSRFKTTLTHLRRAPYQAFAAILISTITFTIISTFSLLFLGTNQMLKYLETQPQVTAFFQDDTSQEQIDQLSKTIER